MPRDSKTRLLIALIPLLAIAWGLHIMAVSDPFFNRNPDPEYPYLINGMNVAIGNFHCIGHLDHPGTPFQLYCGLVIKITHLLTGQGNIASDVLGTRPEYYLRAILGSLVFLHALIALFIGMAAIKRSLAVWIALLLQSSLVLLPWLFSRVNQGRWLMTASMLLILVYLLYGYRGRALSKFAVWAGIVMGMAVATKFNYLPILLLPLLLLSSWKQAVIYAVTVPTSYFLWILPVIDNYHFHIRFLRSIATHDGKYGSGEKRMFNWETTKANFIEILNQNPEVIVLIIAILMGLYWMIRHRPPRDQAKPFLVLGGILLIISIQILMVAKHYSYNYFIPVISTYPLLLFLIYQVFKKYNFKLNPNCFLAVSGGLFVLLGLVKVRHLPGYAHAAQQRDAVRHEIAEVIASDAVWMPTNPLWMRAPYKENALTYAVSYCFYPNTYLDQLSKQNPNVYVLNAIGTKIERWRVTPTETRDLLDMGRPIHFYTTAMHDTEAQLAFLRPTSEERGIYLKLDTVYSSPDQLEHILRVHPVSKAPTDTTGNDLP